MKYIYKSILFKSAIFVYSRFFLPIKVFLLRRQPVIKVAFILSDLGKWKTEPLYIKMKRHPRFDPIILIAPYDHYDNSGLLILSDYLKERNYNYYSLMNGQKVSDVVKPGIIFYQEPYNGNLNSILEYKYNFKSLFCFVNYAFHTVRERQLYDLPLLNFAWQNYFENTLALKSISVVMTNSAKNGLVTGLPFTDLFLSCDYNNPWKGTDTPRTKIIWAPHHTILNEKYICYSTFLEYCDYMIKLADKYKDRIQMAFKPHPSLLRKLYDVWGKEKTENYYSLWAQGENTQLVLGEYVSFFKFSDAMIHDCGSFTVEYHYTKKPVMYLLKDDHHSDGLNEFGKLAFDLHYKGRCKEDIESFINNVINGKDEMRQARERFYDDYLLPPNGTSASDNIINAILG